MLLIGIVGAREVEANSFNGAAGRGAVVETLAGGYRIALFSCEGVQLCIAGSGRGAPSLSARGER